MKSFTDIEQSKKLAKILPIESADMVYIATDDDEIGDTLYTAEFKSEIIHNDDEDDIQCWSLAALLEQLEDTAGLAKDYGLWFCYDNRKSYCTKHYDNPVDACYEMIVTLKKEGTNIMDYEKKYKDALERAKIELNADTTQGTKNVLMTVFPELQESEDEKIKETLIDYFKTYKKQEECGIKTFFGIPTDNIIAWLEKQSNKSNIFEWHSVSEEPEEMKELFCEWESDDATWHDVAFYDEESHTFRHAKKPINVTKWVYVDELLEKQGQKSTLSDEDKMMLNELIIGFYGYRDQYPNFWKLRTDEIIEWLKKKKNERTTDNG